MFRPDHPHQILELSQNPPGKADLLFGTEYYFAKAALETAMSKVK
jgi:hypothetical protein